MSDALLLLVQILSLFLKNLNDHTDCPDGACDEPIAEGEELAALLSKPYVSFGVFDLFRFLRCFPMDRVMAVGKRIVAVFKGCDKCPDGKCDFYDILSCVDIPEVIAIVKEIFDIIKSSQICDDGKKEITLGEAVS